MLEAKWNPRSPSQGKMFAQLSTGLKGAYQHTALRLTPHRHRLHTRHPMGSTHRSLRSTLLTNLP